MKRWYISEWNNVILPDKQIPKPPFPSLLKAEKLLVATCIVSKLNCNDSTVLISSLSSSSFSNMIQRTIYIRISAVKMERASGDIICEIKTKWPYHWFPFPKWWPRCFEYYSRFSYYTYLLSYLLSSIIYLMELL